MYGLSNVRATLIAGTMSMAAALTVQTAPAFEGAVVEPMTRLELGRALFGDSNLSLRRSQSCATCHAPEGGLADIRKSGAVGNDVSLGDDGRSVGTRNAPTAAYASGSPTFRKERDGVYRGGLFWDGRAFDLRQQVGGPPLNPAEMSMPDKRAVVSRLKENGSYVASFKAEYGDDVFQQDDAAYTAMTDALAEYLGSSEFNTFDSRYDRYLKGEEKLTDEEELGRVLFFSQQFSNCSSCHTAGGGAARQREDFTNHGFFNIGVPANPRLRQPVDVGLANNPMVKETAKAKGQFKVPTLRNVAVTAPYMHNGVFKDLRTAVLFYVRYNSRKPSRQINPETGSDWGPSEVAENLATEKLTAGPALDDQRVDALVAFLKTLTDRRYEFLLGKPSDVAD